MDYELHLYISLQPSNNVVHATNLPKLSNNVPWWGVAVSINEEEYQQYFPNGYQTAEGVNRLIKHIGTYGQTE